ncbi:MAG: tRNA 4-thiouridine(8) synthase ThiI [Candidatus Micrarchaeota archaeon]|nr:tRNA 4-thiouridine(8) synthase ThiI [Candidatus Micrarchaeota archaeon]
MAEKYERHVLVHFGELWLRGNNRGAHIAMVRRNIASQLGIDQKQIRQEYDKLLIPAGKNPEKITSRLQNVIGISNFSIAQSTKSDMKSITKLAESVLRELKKSGVPKFRIEASRIYKHPDFTSQDITNMAIKLATKMKIEPDIHAKENTIFFKVYRERTFVYYGKANGINGLPVGSSGIGIVMFSGGIDSPVAAWYAMRRGVIPIYVHLHGFADNKAAEKSKVQKIVEVLSKYYPRYKVYYIPAHIFQLALTKVDNRYEPILLKAMLLRISEKIAKKEGAGAIFTGESLGQVASQTMANLAASQQGVALPILRPLIGMEKQEIIAAARRIGTYDLSILPYKDVCSITARNTVTNSSVEKVGKLLEEMKIDKVVDRSLKAASIVENAPSKPKPRK